MGKPEHGISRREFAAGAAGLALSGLAPRAAAQETQNPRAGGSEPRR